MPSGSSLFAPAPPDQIVRPRVAHQRSVAASASPMYLMTVAISPTKSCQAVLASDFNSWTAAISFAFSATKLRRLVRICASRSA